jgi:hypothetical protein
MDVQLVEDENAQRADLNLARPRNSVLGPGLLSIKIVHFTAADADDDGPRVVAMGPAGYRHSVRYEV